MMICAWCNGRNIPIAQTIGEVVYCCDCGKPYVLYEIEEIWFEQYWHKHKMKPDDD